MKNWTTEQKILLWVSVTLAVILAVISWMIGWGGPDVQAYGVGGLIVFGVFVPRLIAGHLIGRAAWRRGSRYSGWMFATLVIGFIFVLIAYLIFVHRKPVIYA